MTHSRKVAIRRCRDGFSLLEVILALAILLGAIAVLGELVRLGTESAAAARDLSVAQLLCESKLAELAASETLPQAVNSAAFEPEYLGAEGWLYSLAIDSLPEQGLYSVRVTVTEDRPLAERPATCELVRWMRDPNYSTGQERQSATGEATP
jgi:general secretion pathway protein I